MVENAYIYIYIPVKDSGLEQLKIEYHNTNYIPLNSINRL